jgi:prolyl oligopeptidase
VTHFGVTQAIALGPSGRFSRLREPGYGAPMRAHCFVAVMVAGCGHRSPAARPEAASPPAPLGLASPAPAASSGRLLARTVDFTETRFGVTLTDPYRWMEGAENPEVRAWLIGEGERAHAYLARIPGRDALRARVLELGNATGAASGAQLVAGKLFYFKTAPGEQVAKIMVREAGKERVLVDPMTLQRGAGHASVDGFSPSPDGRKLAFNVAAGGSELAEARVVDVATGEQHPDRVERVAGPYIAWLPDNSGFFYPQKAVPRPGVDPMLNRQVRLHLLGAPADHDVPVLASGLSGDVQIDPMEFLYVQVAPGSRWLLACTTGARSEVRYLIAPLAALDRSGAGKTPWRTVAEYADGIAEVIAAHGDRLYLLSTHAASNRRILSVPADHPDLAAARVELVEDPRASIVDFAGARDALYIVKMSEGRARLLRWAWRGQPTEIALPYAGWIDQLVTDPASDGALFDEQGWTQPAAYYGYDPRTSRVAPDALVTQGNVDYSAIVADEVAATSSDGTAVPMSILRRRDAARDGARPTIVYGYGGYGYSQTPSFSPARLAWLERDGVYAVCHVRGGSEKGHAWQVDGTHEHKMNGVHDLEACAQALIDAGLSSPAQLFAQGRSMGGVLIGRAITDRPDLFAAANIQVGILNPLRLHAATNGVTQIPEVGDPETEDGFRAVYAMDPYQHVEASPYPAMLFSIGLNDPRVSPWMTGKMAARMQAQTTSGRPVLIRVDADAGHGIGSTRDQVLAQRADEWSFLLAASGDPAFQPR